MADRQQLVIASSNRGKSAELKALLKDFPLEIKDLNAFGPIPSVVEDGLTFEENAYKKASFTARVLGLPALADDSGLCVAALGGAPGVFSARYAGEKATDADRWAYLLSEMKGKADRRAYFACVISIAVPTGQALTYEARCEGLITEAPAGEGGFGYDPVFYYPPLQKTFAELSQEEKARVSHRGKALGEVIGEMDKILVWLRRHLLMPEKTGCMGAGGS
jgi:XTP/dITP diphosphohydrolase